MNGLHRKAKLTIQIEPVSSQGLVPAEIST